MVTVSIGQEERAIDEVTLDWIDDQIQRRRANRQSICIKVTVRTAAANLVFATQGCGGSGGGGGSYSAREQDLIEMWKSSKLSDADFAAGNVWAFVRRLRQTL
jgi:hypothetical protein